MTRIDKAPFYCSIINTNACKTREAERSNIRVSDVEADLAKDKKVALAFRNILDGEAVGEPGTAAYIEADGYEDNPLDNKSDYVKIIQEAMLAIPGFVSAEDKAAILDEPGAYGKITQKYVGKAVGEMRSHDNTHMDKDFLVRLLKIFIEIKKNKDVNVKKLQDSLYNEATYNAAVQEVGKYLQIFTR